jgi:16S rRNA (guanine527-N7)-methyltransferase
MDEARIAKLLAPFLIKLPGRDPTKEANELISLSPSQLQSISIYIDLLLRWNARVNLTAVRDPEEIVTRHFGESIFAARHLFPEVKEKGAGFRPHVVDVGSGAGFPGLPIKIWAPQVRLTLIESNQKKATFLREVVRSLSLSDVDVFTGRANFFPGFGDFVTVRAVERFEAMLPVAAGLVGPAGSLAMLVGKAQVKPIRNLLPDLKWSDVVDLPLSFNRVLIMGRNESG